MIGRGKIDMEDKDLRKFLKYWTREKIGKMDIKIREILS